MNSCVSFERTNYFRVIDEKKLKDLCGNDVVSHPKRKGYFSLINENGKSVFKQYNKESGDYISIVTDLQNILHSEDAIIVTHIGREKTRYTSAEGLVITKKAAETVDLKIVSMRKPRELLKRKEKLELQMDY
ncbi:hypothetical protein ACH0BF_19680 [Pseudobacillus sp. 179-B 2D1 NHS]|uniref:hypothetical protein n=1 Tax=Pseudobacillus sp. 179-B 2D1 NHS TaxID=3374292 RepID=UPI00387956CE